MFGLFKSEKEKTKDRLRNYKFPKGFFDRLRSSQGWTALQTEENISKYLKFLYLAKYYPPATPSKEVDEVWHLHLIYSDDYWNNLCKKVLKMNLHHSPGVGNKKEDEKYKKQFEDTNSAYSSEFSSPEIGLWGSAENGNSFGGGSFGGSGAGSDWFSGWFGGDSSGGDHGSSHSSCSSDSSSCSSSCGSSCGGD